MTNPHQDMDDAPGCLELLSGPLRLVIASVIVIVATFAVTATRGSIVVLVLSLVGAWRLAKRWPKMGPALAFVAGVMLVVAAAVELLLQMPPHPLPPVLAPLGWVFTLGVVPFGALFAVMRLQNWTKRWLAALEVAAKATTPESPERKKPQ